MGVRKIPRNSQVRWLLAIIVIIQSLLFLMKIGIHEVQAVSSDSSGVQNDAPCDQAYISIDGLQGKIDRVCGELQFITDLRTGLKYLGLRLCGSDKLVIMGTRPSELYEFYQFRNPEFGTGNPVETEFGRINYYLKTFQNYIPINGCHECGLVFVPTPREIGGTAGPTLGLIFPTPTVVGTLPSATPLSLLHVSTPTPTITLTQVPATITPTQTATLTASPTSSIQDTLPVQSTTAGTPNSSSPSIPFCGNIILTVVLFPFIFGKDNRIFHRGKRDRRVSIRKL
jgi:hypothetical protein